MYKKITRVMELAKYINETTNDVIYVSPYTSVERIAEINADGYRFDGIKLCSLECATETFISNSTIKEKMEA